MKRYLIEFSYDGSAYSGYQSQPKLKTVQRELELALKKINNNKKTVIHASGRTDKGVHALCQMGHFDLDISITEHKLKRALNSNLPDDIHVINAKRVTDNFHARYYVKEKQYCYRLNVGEYNPIEKNYIYQCCHPLNINQMKKAIKYFKGKHDFRSFVSENKDKDNCVRTITKVKIKQNKINKNIYEFYFTGDGFLKYQIRNMVGLLIRIGEEKKKPIDVKKILEKKDRRQSGVTAPAQGLYLMTVKYKKEEDDKNGKEHN